MLLASRRLAPIGAWLGDAAGDLRYAARVLARHPGFSVPAALALALGIAAATVIFGAVDAVLLRPLPYADPERLVVVLHDGRHPVAPGSFDEVRRQARSFDAVGAAEWWTVNLARDGAAESVPGLRMTAATLALTGGRPLLGRLFVAEEEQPGRELVVLLGHALWQRRFGGDPAVVGRAVRLDGNLYTVVGVMPPGFAFPPFWARGAELWAPLALGDRLASRSGRSLRLFARLAPGVPLERAREELDGIVARVEAQHPATMKGLAVRPLRDVVVHGVRPALLVLLGAVGLLLLTACANVAHMLLARAASRSREMALRGALGAGRGRVVRQLLTESLLLAALGAAGGIGLAVLGVRLLVAWRPPSVPRIETMAIDARLLALAVVVSLACGLAFGLAPALSAARRDLAGALRQGGRGASAGPGRRGLRDSLVASEVALALVLLVGAGLLMRSLLALHAVDLGFDPKGLLTAVVSLRGSEASAPARRAAFYGEALERVRALPGVADVSAINHVPLAGDIWGRQFQVAGRPPAAPGDSPGAAYRVVLPGYFRTMRLPLLRGRDFDERDARGQPGVVIVNQALAAAQWPGQDPVGRSITLDDPARPDAEWLTVVGVAANAVRREWAAPPAAELYLPYLQTTAYLEGEGGHLEYLTLAVRAEGDPQALAPALRAAVAALAPDAAVSRLQTMESAMAQQLSEPRLYVVLLAGFASVALALAAIGIYGVVGYTVSQRRQEIAIRMALGARSADVVGLVLGDGMRTVALGAAFGLLGSLALGGALSSLLHGVRPSDPPTLAAVVLLLGGVALAATYVPTRRAVSVRPLQALRDE
jgi:putative ABC transport system permease protein